jgi:hypothetical protein
MVRETNRFGSQHRTADRIVKDLVTRFELQ